MLYFERTYSHRNGEETPPAVPGGYHFIGKVDGKWMGHPISPLAVPVGICLFSPSLEDVAKRFKGRWWGPVEAQS